jgi:hypothetical protein
MFLKKVKKSVGMSFFKSIYALLILPICVSSQSLVLAGGNLKDDNAIVYGKMIELAVILFNTRHF